MQKLKLWRKDTWISEKNWKASACENKEMLINIRLLISPGGTTDIKKLHLYI